MLITLHLYPGCLQGNYINKLGEKLEDDTGGTNGCIFGLLPIRLVQYFFYFQLKLI